MSRKRKFPIPSKGLDDKNIVPGFRIKVLDALTVYLGIVEKRILLEHSQRIGLPMGRLLAIAFDNELDSVNPFNYPCTLPTVPYIPGAYADEASKILKAIPHFIGGVGRDQLMMIRRSLGIPSREALMLGYRELLEEGLIEEVTPKPKGSNHKFHFPETYKVTVIADETRESQIRSKEMEIQRATKELEKLRNK